MSVDPYYGSSATNTTTLKAIKDMPALTPFEVLEALGAAETLGYHEANLVTQIQITVGQDVPAIKRGDQITVDYHGKAGNGRLAMREGKWVEADITRGGGSGRTRGG